MDRSHSEFISFSWNIQSFLWHFFVTRKNTDESSENEFSIIFRATFFFWLHFFFLTIKWESFEETNRRLLWFLLMNEWAFRKQLENRPDFGLEDPNPACKNQSLFSKETIYSEHWMATISFIKTLLNSNESLSIVHAE